MPKFVILGSCLHEPYTVLAMPNKLDHDLYESDHEKAYNQAFKLFKIAIDFANIVIVYNEFGIGEHTQEDLDYAIKQGKRVIYTHGEPEQ